MLAEIFRSVANVLLADTARGRMARQLLRAIIVEDDELQDGADPQLPQPPDGNVRQSPDSATRIPRERPPARTKPVLAASDWPALRTQVKAAIAAKGLTRAQAATEIGFNPGTFARWLSGSSRPPGPEALERLRAWVKRPAAGSDQHADPVSPTRLSPGEQAKLVGYVSLGEREARQRFGITGAVLEQASSGASLAEPIITRLREALNGAG
jgi:transcriptional regulator with XRE-family HTH domain